MLDWLLIGIAAVAGGMGGDGGATPATQPQVVEAAPAAQPTPTPVQAPTGKFLTAAEVKPILTMTKPQWVAVREYDGHDLIYFTQLLSWRCGLSAMRYSVNGGPMQQYPLPPCHEDTATPNALIGEEGMPIMGLPPKSVQTLDIEVFYDDTSIDFASYQRAQILIP